MPGYQEGSDRVPAVGGLFLGGRGAGKQGRSGAAGLGLCCSVRVLPSFGEWGLLSNGGTPLLAAVASAVEHGLSSAVHGLLCSMACGIFSDQGSKPMSPELQGRFSTTGPPGKPRRRVLKEADPGPWKAEWGVMCFTLEEVASAVGLKESIDIYL